MLRLSVLSVMPLTLDPKSVPILNNLAISIARQQREAEAISLYERALSLKPGDR